MLEYLKEQIQKYFKSTNSVVAHSAKEYLEKFELSTEELAFLNHSGTSAEDIRTFEETLVENFKIAMAKRLNKPSLDLSLHPKISKDDLFVSESGREAGILNSYSLFSLRKEQFRHVYNKGSSKALRNTMIQPAISEYEPIDVNAPVIIGRFGETIAVLRNGLLGKGGYGEIYLGYDYDSSRWVAVKYHKIKQKINSDQFDREVEILGVLGCLIDYFIPKHSTVYYSVQDLINGENLKEIQKHKYTFNQVLNIGIKLGEAISKLLKQKIVHRDLKIENVMVDENESVRVVDFGLSERMTEEYQLRSTTLVGSPIYMAPELVSKGDILYTVKTESYAYGIIYVHLFFPTLIDEVTDVITTKYPAINLFIIYNNKKILYDINQCIIDKLTLKRSTENDFLIDVIMDLLKSSPNERIDVDSAVIKLKTARIARTFNDSLNIQTSISITNEDEGNNRHSSTRFSDALNLNPPSLPQRLQDCESVQGIDLAGQDVLSQKQKNPFK